MKTNYCLGLWIAFFSLVITDLSGANYEWKGFDNTDWNTLNNWRLGSGASPASLPGPGDNVLIDGTGGLNAIPVLANDVTISSLTIDEGLITKGGLDLNSFTLSAGSLTVNSSLVSLPIPIPIPVVSISNGKFDISGSVNISGGVFTDVDIDGGNFPTLEDATFTADVVFTKTGSGNMGSPGDGMVYQGDFTFINDGSGNVRFGSDAANTYEGNVTLENNTASNLMAFGQNFAASISGDLTITNSSTNSGAIEIGRSGGGANVGGSFILSSTAGAVIMTDVVESGIGGIISITSGTNFEADDCIFNGSAVIIISGTINSIDGSSFNGATNLFSATTISNVNNSVFGPVSGGISTTFIQNVGSNTPWVGGNTFNTEVTFTRNGSTNRNWRLANSTPNTYKGDVTINYNGGTGDLIFANSGASFPANLTLNGTGKNAGGTVTMAGTSGTQTIDGTSTGWTFPSLVVSNTDGVNLGFSISISSALNLSGILTMTDMMDNQVTMATGASFTGSADGFINNGILQKLGNTAFNSSPSFIFHVGADGFYAPFYYTTSNSGGNPEVTVQYTRPGPGPGTPPSPLELVSQTEQWLLTVDDTGLGNTAVTLPYGVQSGAIGDEADLRVARSNDGGSSWINLGGTAGGGEITGSTQTFSAGSSYVITLASINASQTPLPVELMYFKAQVKEKTVQLEWATATELNNDYFQVERSADGIRFEPLGVPIDGAGTTSEPLNYEFTDRAPLSGISYYRLRQVDFGGQMTYSDVVPVRVDGAANNEVVVFPNPVRDQLQILWGGELGIERLRLFDASGKVWPADAIIDNKQARLELQNLPSGVYFLELLSGRERKVERIVIQ